MGYTVTKDGRVTLPKDLRDAMALEPGSRVEFRLNDHGEWVVERVGAPRRSGRFGRWRGFFGPGPSTDEIMALTRGNSAEA
jgi:AbrB family looped-hinge helix DNA binding protein